MTYIDKVYLYEERNLNEAIEISRYIDILTNDIYSTLNESYILNESVGSVIKTLIRKLKELWSQIVAFFKKIAGFNRVEAPGKYLDINGALSAIDRIISVKKIKEDESVPLKEYKEKEKVDTNRLQTVINKTNKFIDVIESQIETFAETKTEAKKIIGFFMHMGTHAKNLMSSLMPKKSLGMEEARNKFMEDFKFQGNKKSGEGTIEFEGKRIRVICIPANEVTEENKFTGYNIATGIIQISHEIYRCKTKTGQMAIIKHELGHEKYTRPEDYPSTFGVNLSRKDLKKVDNDKIKKYQDEQIKRDNERDKSGANKRQDEEREKLKKHEDPSSPHSKYFEFEADIHAGNKYGDKEMLKAIKPLSKKSAVKKMVDKNDLNSMNAAKNLGMEYDNIYDSFKFANTFVPYKTKLKLNQKASKADYKSRKKALKDKSIDRSIYNDSVNMDSIMTKNEYIASIMLEAADLLREDSSDDNEEAIFKKAYDECVKVIKPIIKNIPAFSIEEFNYDDWGSRYSSKTNKSHSTSSTPVVDYDLWDFYPDARTRFSNNDMKEFDNVYNKIVGAMKKVVSKYGLKIEYSGDWDGGPIEIVKWK